MEMVKKKRMAGLIASGIFILWAVIEMVQYWIPFKDYFDYFIQMGVMPAGDMIKEFVYYVGRPKMIFCLCVGLMGVIIGVLAFVGSKKNRVNVFFPAVLLVVSVAALLIVLANLKNANYRLNTENASGKKVLLTFGYILAGGVPAVILLINCFMAALGASGRSFLKKRWYIPAALYILWVGGYYFCIGIVIAYLSQAVVLSQVFSVHNFMQIIFGIGIGALGYWIALYMPEKPSKAKIDGNAIADAWGTNQVPPVQNPVNMQVNNGVQNSAVQPNGNFANGVQNGVVQQSGNYANNGQNQQTANVKRNRQNSLNDNSGQNN